jgi:hypothetical protein
MGYFSVTVTSTEVNSPWHCGLTLGLASNKGDRETEPMSPCTGRDRLMLMFG